MSVVISIVSGQDGGGGGPAYALPDTGIFSCGYFTLAAGGLVGSAETDLGLNGATVIGMLEVATANPGASVLIIAVAGAAAKSLFTSVTPSNVGSPAPATYLSADASYAPPGTTVSLGGFTIGGAGITCWAWVTTAFHSTFNTAYETDLTFTTPPPAGYGDITNPGAWEDGAGHIPPLAYQQVPQTVNYPLNGDGRYWFAANALAPSPSPITFIGDPAYYVGTMSLQWSITQAATDGSSLYVGYSLDGGTTWTATQIGPSVQRGSLLSGQIKGTLAGTSQLMVEVYSTGGTSSASAKAWNVAVAITRNVNETIAWDSPNPFDPISYNGEIADDVTPTETLLELRTRLMNRLNFKELVPPITGQTLASMRKTVLQRIGYASQTANPTPGMVDLVNTFINEAQQTLYRRYAEDAYTPTAPPILVADTDVLTLDNMAVQMLSIALAKGHYGQPDAAAMMKAFETYLGEVFKRSPPNLVAILNDFLIDGQQYLYKRYTQLHTMRMFRWKVNPGQRFYSFKDNDENVLSNFHMDPMKSIEWSGIQDSRNVWYPLVEGIDPQLYTMIDKPWRPARFIISNCIELYPSPDQTYWMWMRAHFGLLTFANDSDSTTIDSELLFLHALSVAKAHYGQPDAANVQTMANSYRKELIAGTHGKRRYIPGTIQVPPAVRPTLLHFQNS